MFKVSIKNIGNIELDSRTTNKQKELKDLTIKMIDNLGTLAIGDKIVISEV